MIRALTISAIALFSIMLVVGETVAQERSVLQEGFSGIGTGKIGSGPGGGIVLTLSVIRAAVTPTQLVAQAGYQPDTDRGISSSDSSTLGGVGGQCWNCYSPDSGYGTDYEKGEKKK